MLVRRRKATKREFQTFTKVTVPVLLHKTSVSNLMYREGKRHLGITCVSPLVWGVKSNLSFMLKTVKSMGRGLNITNGKE